MLGKLPNVGYRIRISAHTFRGAGCYMDCYHSFTPFILFPLGKQPGGLERYHSYKFYCSNVGRIHNQERNEKVIFVIFFGFSLDLILLWEGYQEIIQSS